MSHRSMFGAGFIVCLILATCAPCFAAADVPEGFTLIKSNDAGKSMSVVKPAAKSVHDAIESVLDNLDDYFDDDYDVTGGLEDQRDHRSGLAVISAKYHGSPVKGLVITRLRDDKGAVVVVVFGKADSSKAQWAELFGTQAAKPADDKAASAPRGAPGGDAPKADAPDTPRKPDARAADAPAQLPDLKPYRFPDGTGVVGLAEGWQTNATTCLHTVIINGPADQTVFLGASFAVNTPDSTAVQMARQYGTGGVLMLVGPLVEPAPALEMLEPQISRFEEQNGRPALAVDHVKKIADLKPMLDNATSAVVSFGLTKTANGQQKHYQGIAQISVSAISNQSWMFWMSVATAPDETAKQDMPVMIATINSWRTNDQLVTQKSGEAIAESNRRFDISQQANRDLQNAYAKNNEQWRADQTTRSRAADDFDETIRGFRTVHDTHTGEEAQVELGKTDDVVNQLNADDPGRYKAIPLRDKADPLK